MKHIKTATLASFWRCGVQHTKIGATFGDDQFSAEQWARLQAEARLIVTEVAAPVPTPEGITASLVNKLKLAIDTLTPDDFGKSGVPSVGALREALPEDADHISTSLRDTVWDELKAGGFKPPEPETKQDPDQTDTKSD